MRFGFHQLLDGRAHMLALHDVSDLPGAGVRKFMNRIADYTMEDAGSVRLCDAAGGFGTLRWIVTPSH